MSDPASTARTARESLARGLAALQSDPNVPPQLVELAAPIAQSMGALHHIERSNGTQLVPHAGLALENVRAALARLQSQPSNHPAVAIAMEAVASSLGLVHALSQLATPPQAAAPHAPHAPAAAFAQQQNAQQQQAVPAQGYPAPQAYAAPQQASRPNVAPMAQTVAAPQQQMQQPQAHYPQTPYAQQPPQAPPQQYAQPVQQPHVPQQAMPQQAMPQQAMPQQQQGGFAARDPFAAAAPAPAHAQHVGANAPAASASGDALYVTADLGAQSPTNFYKGLSGNDIVDHGGLFVSTYMIPKIGTPVRLKVSLPGGYEFEADASVRWARDVRDASSDAPPGFGAQFTNITPEARQLIYRYVRNREPLFHDDL